MKEYIKHFEALPAQQILAKRPGDWDDYGLLDVLDHFTKQRDRQRAAAVTSLILRSPEHSEMVTYSELYFELMEAERWAKNDAAALRWAYAGIAYAEQHDPELNRANRSRDLAETYLYTGDVETGLAILTRCLQADPTDIWTYNILGLSLPRVGLSDLAVEVLDQALKRVTKKDPATLKQQFERLRQEAVEKVAAEESRLPAIAPAVLADLRAALPATASGQPGGLTAYLPPVDRLITTEGDTEAALEAEIMAQGKVLALDLIRLAFDETLQDTPAPGRAVALLRQLQVDQAVELAELKPWLDRAEGNWPVELLTRRMGKIGGYTTTELETIAADTGYHLFVRTSATDALVERAQKCPAQRERIVNFMRRLLTRPEATNLAAEETLIGFLISDALDLEARELYPDIEAAYQEDRVDTTIVDLAFVQEKWGRPVSPLPKRREDGLYLRLRCTECGREREHFVQDVLVDSGSQKRKAAGQPDKYDPHIMDREIICPKCGSVDRYELTPQSSLRLLIPTAGLESFVALFRGDKEQPKFKPHPRVHYFESLVFGQPMHPLVGLDKYKELIAANPNDVTLRMKMGNLLRTLHRYPQALESFRQGATLGTNNPEYTLTRAMAEHDFGDRPTAKKLYEETISLAAKQLFRSSGMIDLIQTARQGLKSLTQGKASPWELDIVKGGSPPPPPASPAAQRTKPGPTKSKRKMRRRGK